MFGNIRRRVADWFVRIKKSVTRNKLIYIAVIVGVFFGVLCAIPDIDGENASNIIIVISDGDFNFLFFYLKIIFFTLGGYFLCLLLTFNKIAFCFNVLTIILFTKYIVKSAVIACIAGWSGLILLVLLYIPLFVVNIWLFAELLCVIWNNLPCGKIMAVFPLKYACCGIKKEFKRYFLGAILFNVLYSSLLLIIFTIIFR